MLRDYKARTGREIKLANTEWLPNPNWVEPFDDPEYPQTFDWETPPQTDDRKNSRTRMVRWFYALNGAQTMMGYLSLGGEFLHGNFNNCCNTWGGNVIESAKEKAWYSPAGLMMGFFTGSSGMYPLETLVVSKEEIPVYSVALEQNDGGLTIFVLNRAKSERAVELNIPNEFKFESGTCLSAESPLARMLADRSEITRNEIKPSGNTLTLPPLCIARIDFGK